MKIAIIGIVGVPGRYGGFETLAENLVHYHKNSAQRSELTVWCSGKDNATHPPRYQDAQLRYVNLRANGVQSIPYDVFCLWQAIRSGHDRIVMLGVSGALVLPLVRLLSRARVTTNIDGIEWKRAKWKSPARFFLRASEWAAVRFSHDVIADNAAIAEHVRAAYDSECHVIAYGGDHAVAHANNGPTTDGIPESYALALCRIEPENNVHMILDAWAHLDTPLVFVGNWSNSAYGRALKARHANHPNLYLLDPVYDPGALYALRARASVYVHGHSAGGTNPALVEMMHFGVPILAHGCRFNRYSTENKARYFETSDDLIDQAQSLTPQDADSMGIQMQEIARRCYTWDHIGNAYFTLLNRPCTPREGR